MKKLLAVLLALTLTGGIGDMAAGRNSVLALDRDGLGDLGDLGDLDISSGGTYSLKADGTYEVTGWESKHSLVHIPETYNGRAVTSIGELAFFDHDELASVTIPGTVTSIGRRAFAACSNLEAVVIPSSVASIGDLVFEYTPWLEEKRAENPVVVANTILVDAATTSGDVVLPDGLTAICGYAFYENEAVTSVVVPDTVTSIGNSAFNHCKQLISVNVPEGVTEIHASAFSYCESLTELKLPSTVTSIEEHAFWGCTGLSSFVIPEGVTSVGEYAFAFCTKLKNVTLPTTLKTVGSYAFDECRALGDITFPAGVESIGENCFWWAFPASVTILNPDCEILGDADTLYNKSAVVYGYVGSTAQVYAETYGFTFKPIAPLSGDVNTDNEVNAADAAEILAESALTGSGQAGHFTDAQKTAADVNNDGMIDASDAAYILAYAAAVGSGEASGSIEDFIG